MGNEKADDYVQHFVTCAYCGTQTPISFKRLEGEKPLKCRTCGAPLKVVPPPKPRAKRRKKIDRDYGVLLAERSEYDRRLKEEENIAGLVGAIIIGGLLITIILFIWVLGRC